MVLWKTRGFERNYDFSIRVDRRVFDVQELESEVRSLVSTMVLWKTRGFERNYGFSIRVGRRVFAVEELESDIGFSLV
jgi:CHASE3 domain sensor protein